MKTRNNILFSFFFVSLFFGFSLIGQETVKDFSPLFSILMENANGKSIKLSDEMNSNGIVVVFSCNTCPFVVGNDNFEGWEKEYNDLYQKAKEAKLGFVLLNSNEAKREDEDSFKAMKKHAKEMTYKMSYLVDKDSKIANELGAKTTPHVFVFNASKNLIFKGSINNKWDSSRTNNTSYLIDIIQKIQTNQTLTYSESEPRGCSIKRKK